MPSAAVSPAQCLALLPKLNNEDPDIRYMSLNDLCALLESGSSGFLSTDYHTCAKIIDGIITTLDDQNGEVQNQAIKCLGALVLKLPADILAPFIHRVSNMEPKNSVDASITTTALRKFVTSFPTPLPGVPPSPQMNEAYSAISKVLIPRLIGYVIFQQPGTETLHTPPPGMLEIGTEKGVNGDAVDVLIEIIRCFGAILRDAEKQELQKNLMFALNDERAGSVVKKKAVVAISQLCIHLQEPLLKAFVSQLQNAFQDPKLTAGKQKLLLSVVGSISRSIPQRLGPFAKSLVPHVLTPLSQEEYEETLAALEDGEPDAEVDEVREAALLALEGFLSCCSNAMRPYTQDSIAAAARYVSYDPNSTEDDDDDDSMDGTQDDDEDDFTADDDEDFEQEGAFSDDEDSSWKIRRCAAKSLYAIISTRSNGDLLDDGTLYDKVAPILVKRFKEREENVRLEVLTALGLLIRKTGNGTPFANLVGVDSDLSAIENRRSRKRRRVDSDAPTLESAGAFASTLGLNSPVATPSPVSGPRAELGRLSSAITKGVSQLLRQSSNATKQVAVSLLRDLVLVQSGGLSESLPKILEPLLDLIKAAGSVNGTTSIVAGLSAGSEGNLRIDALQLLAAICDTHSSVILASYINKIIANTIEAANDKFYKVSGEALVTLESIIKAITPPRSAGTDQQRREFLSDIDNTVQKKITASDSDLEVRQKALHTLGVLLARTAGSSNTKLFPTESRLQALNTLQARLKNETTRLSAVKAVEIVAVSAKDKNDLDPKWTRQVALELGAQLRKADRNLRSGSLVALRALVFNSVASSKLDESTIADLAKVLSPLLVASDLNVFSIVSSIMAKLVKVSPRLLVDKNLVDILCEACKSPLSGNAFVSFLDLVQSIGERGVGQDLMRGFLQNVGVSGDYTIVGKAIGTLLVSGGSSVGVEIGAFESELKTSKDPSRQCLALSIIGEAGFRLGSSFTLQPATFTSHFNSKSDPVRRAAATALGRAGASNTKTYLPVILSLTGKAGKAQYLSLYSIKEILLNAGNTRSDISPYSKQIWDHLLQTAQAEDSKILGSECIGRLTAIEPTSFLPTLQAYLRESNPAVRSMAIQAIRFTFTDSDEAFDEVLRPVLVSMLSLMLADPNTENRRLALGTLNAALQHKADIVLPQLGAILPLVLKDSKIDPDLIREVQMGPFKHKVDDGLELRKSAYETLFSLLDAAYSRISPTALFERVIEGLGDEHEIKMLCSSLLTKLIVLDSNSLLLQLDPIAEAFKKILTFKPKENAVKQEVEKANEANKAVLTVTVGLAGAFPGACGGTYGGGAAGGGVAGQGWRSYWEWLGKEQRDVLTRIENEVRSQAA